MKAVFLLTTCCFLAATVYCFPDARTKGRDVDVRALIVKLQTLLERMSSTNDTSQPDVILDPLARLKSFLDSEAKDLLDTPVFEIPLSRLEQIIDGSLDILIAGIQPQTFPVVALRVTTAFVEHIIYDGFDKIFHIIDTMISENAQVESMAGTGSTTWELVRKLREKKAESSTQAAKSKGGRVSGAAPRSVKRYHDEQMSEADMTVWGVTFAHLADPAMDAIALFEKLMREYDGEYYGNLFYEIESLIEDEAILHETLAAAVMRVAHHIGHVLYRTRTEDCTVEPAELYSTIISNLKNIAEFLEGFNASNVPGISLLPPEEKETLLRIFTSVEPLVHEMARPVRRLHDLFSAGDADGIVDMFKAYIGELFAMQLEILYSLTDEMETLMTDKTQALTTVMEALTSEEEKRKVFLAIFTKIGEKAIAMGAQLDEVKKIISSVLDDVAMMIEEEQATLSNQLETATGA